MADGASHRQRRSIRLPHDEYGDAGTYYPLCSEPTCFSGEVVDRSMVLNELGRIVATEWRRTAEIRPNVAVDEFVVMPNHFHALLEWNCPVGAYRIRPYTTLRRRL